MSESPMDFFGQASPLSAVPSISSSSSASSQGGSNSTGGFSFGDFNNGGVDEKWLIGGGVAVALIIAIVMVKS